MDVFLNWLHYHWIALQRWTFSLYIYENLNTSWCRQTKTADFSLCLLPFCSTAAQQNMLYFLHVSSAFTICFPSTVPGLESRSSCKTLHPGCVWMFHFLSLPNSILWSSGCFPGCTDKMCGCEGLDVTVRRVVISYEPPPSPRWLFLWPRLLFFFFSAKKFAAHRLINRRDGCRLSALMLLLQLKHEAQTDYYSLSSS